MTVEAPRRALTGGEIDPDLYYATDIAQVRAGAAKCRNFIVRPKGGVERLAGTEFLGEAKTSARVRLGRFHRSSGITYLAEYGPGYVRLYPADMVAGDAHVSDLGTPYQAGDLLNLQWVQSKDVQWIFSGLKVKELRRTGASSFALANARINDGPFLDQSYLEDREITASAVTGGAITLTASDDIWQAEHVGALWRLHERNYASVPRWKTSSSLNVGDTVRYNGNVYEVTGAGTTSPTPPDHTSGTVTDGKNGPKFKYLHSGFGLVKITGYTNAKKVTAEVISQLPVDLLTGSQRWQEGAWSDVQGYPICGALWKRSLWAGGTIGQPDHIWKSAIEDFKDWSPGTRDDSAITRACPDGETETIRWMAPGKTMTLGTDGPEWVARPQSTGDTVRPNNLVTEPTTNQGSSDVPGLSIGRATVFPDASRRRLILTQPVYRTEDWEERDLSLLASHLLGAGIIETAYQRTPWPVLWCLLQDGKVAAVTYLADQELVAWHLHDFGDPVESLTVLAVDGGKREALFLAVRRGDKVCLERMFDRFRPEAGDTVVDAKFLFSAKVYDGAPATVFAGLDHLEGREVVALVDGNQHPAVTVTGGQVTLTYEGSTVLIGLPVRGRYAVGPFDRGLLEEADARGPTRLVDVSFAFQNTMGGDLVVAGVSEPVFRLGDANLDETISLVTDVVKVASPATEDTGQFEYVTSDAWPATITAIFPEHEVS